MKIGPLFAEIWSKRPETYEVWYHKRGGALIGVAPLIDSLRYFIFSTVQVYPSRFDIKFMSDWQHPVY